MRDVVDSPRVQMKRADPRTRELFHNLRRAVDILEQITLHQCLLPASEPASEDAGAFANPTRVDSEKQAYTTKELRKLIGFGHSTIYQAIKNKEVRAVKYGRKALILAKDLQVWIDACANDEVEDQISRNRPDLVVREEPCLSA